jgi:hypothetical protein
VRMEEYLDKTVLVEDHFGVIDLISLIVISLCKIYEHGEFSNKLLYEITVLYYQVKIFINFIINRCVISLIINIIIKMILEECAKIAFGIED